ncbi:hypothetical protein BXZ70DRAFT_1011168 [Cristinia sonorae]|uniref:Uncharacterized protein n=1 Tax=Cristinia sonorae TaxID=1940300 RepID=A0A8K0UJ82_9AGAR|nr:hypothetical protein BXZ70DRAFT_1011168 [Cristinia sonorae]
MDQQPHRPNFLPVYIAAVMIISICILLWTQYNPVTAFTYTSDDHPTNFPPSLPKVKYTLQRLDDSFSLYSDDDWGTIFPKPWSGFMSLGPDNQPYTLTLYHQLHCLDAIRVSFVVNGTGSGEHVEHCLRYLKQTLLCNADTTLEPAHWLRNTAGGRVPASNGVGVVHECKGWEALRRIVEDNPVIIPK